MSHVCDRPTIFSSPHSCYPQAVMASRIYLDYNATTPVDPAVLEAMLPFFSGEFGNAASIHTTGQKARSAVETAREQVAALINAHPQEIIFTSGGTESDNHAIFGMFDPTNYAEAESHLHRHRTRSRTQHLPGISGSRRHRRLSRRQSRRTNRSATSSRSPSRTSRYQSRLRHARQQ